MFRPLLLLALLVCLPGGAAGLTVFAAASLKTALDPIAAAYGAATGVRIRLTYAGSSALARQIEQGAPADLFVSASPAWMDVVAGAGLLEPGSRRDLLANRLVLVAHGAADPVSLSPSLDLAGLLGDGRLAMALVDAVPAGQYGQAALRHFGLWEAARPRIAEADNVRAALALVALGAAPYGIVYATDAAAEPRVSVVAHVPAESHPPIRYPAAVIAGGDAAAAARFLAHLTSDDAWTVFAAQGFRRPTPDG